MSKAAQKKRQRAMRDGVIVKPEPRYVETFLVPTNVPQVEVEHRFPRPPVTHPRWRVEPDVEPEPVDPKELQRRELRDELRRLFEKRRQQGFRPRHKRPLFAGRVRISYLTQQLRELRS